MFRTFLITENKKLKIKSNMQLLHNKCFPIKRIVYGFYCEAAAGTVTVFSLINIMSPCPCPSEPPAVDFDVSVKNGVIIKAGESLKLPAVVTGQPQPEVKWAKDEAEIDKERMIVETDGKNSILFIKKAVRADHGKYQISGTNSSGTKAAETRVDVMGQCFY